MNNEFALCAYFTLLLLAFCGFVAWYSSYIAAQVFPEPDDRVRPSQQEIDKASRLLFLQLPATDEQIRQAERSLLPRAPGDTFPDGTLRNAGMTDRFAAAKILLAANEYDSNPPYEARHLVAYWEYRAGVLGRVWGRLFPPKGLVSLRKRARIEADLPKTEIPGLNYLVPSRK